MAFCVTGEPPRGEATGAKVVAVTLATDLVITAAAVTLARSVAARSSNRVLVAIVVASRFLKAAL